MNEKINTEQLKDYIPITDVVNRLGIKLNKALQGDCPTGHSSNGHKCFSINDKKNYYHCFHCNKSGDIISLVGLVLNMDFLQSVDWLKENFGYGNGKKIKAPTPKQEEVTQELIEKDALYELVYKYGKEMLYKEEGREALNYLTLVRQYDYESLKKTDWIYFPKDSAIRKHLLTLHPESSKQISKLSLQGAYKDKLCLAFPYRNRQGLITGFVKRAIKQEGVEIEGNMVRYDSTTGLSKYDLFNLNNCKGLDEIIIVEGYPEGLYFPTQGISNITAIGAGLLSKTHIVGIKEFGIKSVILCLDNDESGINNTQEALKLLADNNINAVAIGHEKLAPYKDPDEYVKAKGIDKFLALVTEARKSVKQEKPINQETAEVKFFKLTDYGNAERLVYYHGDNIRYCEPLKSWFIWDGKRWKPDDSLEIMRLAKDVARKIYGEAGNCEDEDMRKAIASYAKSSESANKLKAMVEVAKSEKSIIITPEDLDKDGYLLNCQNGTVDLRSGLMNPHTKTDYLTKITPVVFDPDAECPRWHQFLDEIFRKDQEIIRFAKYAAGYTLTDSVVEECIFLCHGRGRNGKSKYIDTLEYIMGDYGKNVDPSTFEEKKKDSKDASEDIARLKGARFISTMETGEGKRLNESMIKQMTGNRLISARQLYQSTIQFQQTYKIWLATNHKPIIRGTDDAIWERINLIPFEVYFKPEERDPNLFDKLVKEASGILNWMVEGCLVWQGCGLKAITPEKVRVATGSYRKDMDILGSFIDEKCELNPTLVVTKQLLYSQYCEWCKESGMDSESKIKFGRRLLENYEINEKSGADNVQLWLGIGIRGVFSG